MWVIRGCGLLCTWRFGHRTCFKSSPMNHRLVGSATYRGHFRSHRLVNEDTPVRFLTLSDELRDSMVAFLRRCLPHEGVGLLAASRIGSSLIAVRFYPGQNMDSSPRRYTMDPTDVMPALADMKRREIRLGAIVHSHPNTPPVPSRTDLVEAKLPGVLSLIVGMSPVVELRAWSLVFDGHGVAVRSEEIPITCPC
jgi:proteasome lid subunit RPN8/RPN11